jgi:hypothetical protein
MGIFNRRVLGERMDGAAFQKAGADLEEIRKEAQPLIKAAHDKLDTLSTDSQLSLAREQAIAAGVLKPGEDFLAGSDTAAKRTFLKHATKPADDRERLEALRRFVALLTAS